MLDLAGLALAFVLGAVLSVSEATLGRPAEGRARRMLQALRGGSFALLGAGLCNAVLVAGWVAKTRVQSESGLVTKSLLLHVLVGLAVGIAVVWLTRALLVRKFAWTFGFGVVAVLVAGLSAARAARSPKPPPDEAFAGYAKPIELDAITLEIASHHQMVESVELEYLAVGSSCVIFTRETRDYGTAIHTVIVPVARKTPSAVHCPRIELRKTEEAFVGGVVDQKGELEPLFRVSGDKLVPLVSRNNELTGIFELLAKHSRETARGASVAGELPAITAPRRPLDSRLEVDGLVIERHGSDLDPASTALRGKVLGKEGDSSRRECTVTMSIRGRVVAKSKQEGSRTGDQLVLCPKMTVRRARTVDVYEVRTPQVHQVTLLVGGEEFGGDLSLRALRGRIGAPRAFRYASVAGALLGGLALLVALGLWVPALGRRAWIDASHDGTGVVVLDDGRSVRAPAAAELDAGPVMVRGEVPPSVGRDYRRAAAPPLADLQVVAGSRAEQRQRARDAARLVALLALCLAVALAAPLVSAATSGLGW